MGKRERPDIYSYHEYRAFLKDWVEYRRWSRPGFSLRSLAAEAGLAVGYLPTVLSGSRDISMKALFRLTPVLALSKPEGSYLENLVRLCTAESQEERIDAVGRMNRSAPYQRRNPKEAELVEYMSRWYHIAIRELAGVPGFKAEPEWIQKQLKTHVTTAEIGQALKFLVKRGYLALNADGSVQAPKEQPSCSGGIHKVALTHYHRQMFGLAAASIDHTPRTERDLFGHTFLLDTARFEKARNILNEALSKIQELGGASKTEKNKNDASVYHVELALFPMTRKGHSTG